MLNDLFQSTQCSKATFHSYNVYLLLESEMFYLSESPLDDSREEKHRDSDGELQGPHWNRKTPTEVFEFSFLFPLFSIQIMKVELHIQICDYRFQNQPSFVIVHLSSFEPCSLLHDGKLVNIHENWSFLECGNPLQ